MFIFMPLALWGGASPKLGSNVRLAQWLVNLHNSDSPALMLLLVRAGCIRLTTDSDGLSGISGVLFTIVVSKI